MPKVRISAENHVPLELLQVKAIYGTNVMTHHVDKARTLDASEREAWKLKARILTAHLREAWQLEKADKIVSLGLGIYHEYDEQNRAIPEAGALISRPVIEKADGTRIRSAEPRLWVDSEHRPVHPLTEEDIRFCGQIAMQSDELSGGWHAHRLSAEATTPRDALQFSELAEVIPITRSSDRLPMPSLAPAGTVSA